MSVYIIAEAGVNHNGSVSLAKKLIEASKVAGADAVKFQTYKTEKILTREVKKADYQQKYGSNISQFQMIKELELSYADFKILKSYADSIGIEFLSTPDDEDSLNFLVDVLGLNKIKVGSGEVTNFIFLRQIAAKQKQIILSTGMSTLGEVEKAVRLIRMVNNRQLILLHCTTNYPCSEDEVNLRAMHTLQRAFNSDIGYSDHTIGLEVPVAAVALGATVIEKHITLDVNMSGPDHRASIDPKKFAEMVRQIRFVEKALGDGIKWPSKSEEMIKPLVRRRLVAAKNLSAGTCIDWSHLNCKRANSGIYAEQAEYVIGRTIHFDMVEDSVFEWNLLSS